MGNEEMPAVLKGIEIMQNYFEQLVRANYRFGRMCVDLA